MPICKKCKEAARGMLCGQGFRDFTCKLCGKTDTWHNTDTPVFCEDCSKILQICQRCGDDLYDE